ncbi:hypothetical protein VM98_38465, partial [Streptomyces rubellomurinus subsp. indigoferus]
DGATDSRRRELVRAAARDAAAKSGEQGVGDGGVPAEAGVDHEQRQGELAPVDDLLSHAPLAGADLEGGPGQPDGRAGPDRSADERPEDRTEGGAEGRTEGRA